MAWRFHPSMKASWLDEARCRSVRGMEHTARMGYRWNEAEKACLLHGYLTEGLSVPALAKRHERGSAGIAAQLDRLMALSGSEQEELRSHLPGRPAGPDLSTLEARITALEYARRTPLCRPESWPFAGPSDVPHKVVADAGPRPTEPSPALRQTFYVRMELRGGLVFVLETFVSRDLRANARAVFRADGSLEFLETWPPRNV